MSERIEFECHIVPFRDGRWEVRIQEIHGYRSVAVDAALNRWPLKRIGAAWTTYSVVGRYLTSWRAGHEASRALRIARETADENAVELDRHRRHMDHAPIVVREGDRP